MIHAAQPPTDEAVESICFDRSCRASRPRNNVDGGGRVVNGQQHRAHEVACRYRYRQSREFAFAKSDLALPCEPWSAKGGVEDFGDCAREHLNERHIHVARHIPVVICSAVDRLSKFDRRDRFAGSRVGDARAEVIAKTAPEHDWDWMAFIKMKIVLVGRDHVVAHRSHSEKEAGAPACSDLCLHRGCSAKSGATLSGVQTVRIADVEQAALLFMANLHGTCRLGQLGNAAGRSAEHQRERCRRGAHPGRDTVYMIESTRHNERVETISADRVEAGGAR